MPNGLLFVLLAVMWAVVLIPMWLRKHDESNESRSVDRFSRALGSLSARLERGQDADGQETVVVHRPSKAPSGREVLMPGRPRGSQSADVVVTGASARQVARTPVSAAGRRRRVLVGLLVLALALLTAGLAHAVPLWTAVVPVVVAGILVVTARRQAALRAEMARRRVRRTELTDAARAAQSDRPVARRGSRAVMPASAAAAGA
ncbi:MAG TPA: hypothetical protein VFN19_07905, partial [Candidatus Nanopelagicales bacterium]|nr:hypothetical protein [Candidatus Nanopelagicales bacterium]